MRRTTCSGGELEGSLDDKRDGHGPAIHHENVLQAQYG